MDTDKKKLFFLIRVHLCPSVANGFDLLRLAARVDAEALDFLVQSG